jgi:hypothetical protein
VEKADHKLLIKYRGIIMNKFIYVVAASFVISGCATSTPSIDTVAGLKANYEHCLVKAGNNVGQCDKEKDRLWQEEHGWPELLSEGS